MRSAIAVSMFVLVGCVSDPVVGDAGLKMAGTRGGACLPMNQCVTGLTCLDGTCVELPDSGSPGDSGSSGDGATDAGQDGMMMGCALAKPSLRGNCLQTDVPCIVANQLVCKSSESVCGSSSGKSVACAGSSTCGMPCCLDPTVMPLAGMCPDKYSLGTGARVTACGQSCPGREICVNDGDCIGNFPHCHPAIFDTTQVQFGVCGP